MILIADSGSTKCSWALCNEKGETVLECNTIGFNPYFIDSRNILKHLNKSVLEEYIDSIKIVFFYGAGCSSAEKNRIVEEPLQLFFKNAKVSIRHDIDAACYAMYNGNPNITCILGTGSNSCFYDGYSVFQNGPSLGFLLGDEASGNYFGKKLLTLYFNKALPKGLSKKFKEGFETDLPIIKENIYGNNRANVYLSKYFPFVSSNKNHTIIKDLIYDSLDEFFSLHVCCFKNHTEVEINFIGSVAYFLSDEIKIIAKKYNCKVGDIIKDPIYNLVEFHFNKIRK